MPRSMNGSTRAHDEVFDGARDHYLARACGAGHPRPDVYRYAADIAVAEPALAGVDANPHLDAEWPPARRYDLTRGEAAIRGDAREAEEAPSVAESIHAEPEDAPELQLLGVTGPAPSG